MSKEKVESVTREINLVKEFTIQLERIWNEIDDAVWEGSLAPDEGANLQLWIHKLMESSI